MIYNYIGFDGNYGICDLEIIESLVIATEIPENESTSITNMAEHLATQVCQDFDIAPKKLIWIEHYPQRGEMSTRTGNRPCTKKNDDVQGGL